MFFERRQRRRVDRRKQSQTPKGRGRGTGGGPQTRGRAKARRPRPPVGLPPGWKEGGQVENGHNITYARGSGAARPQKFRKNG